MPAFRRTFQLLHKGRRNFLFWLTVMSICWHFNNSTIRSKMLLNVRTFKRYQAWLAFVHLGFTLNPRFMTVGLGDWSMRFIVLSFTRQNYSRRFLKTIGGSLWLLIVGKRIPQSQLLQQ